MVDLLSPRLTPLPSRLLLEEKTVFDHVNFTLTLCAPRAEMRIGLLVFNNPINMIDSLGLDPVSITHATEGGVMVHSEVPVPSGGVGNVHLQVGDTKYFFNTQTGGFPGLPKDLSNQIKNSQKLQNGIKNAVSRCNANGGFAPKYGGGSGLYIPLIAAALALADGTAQANQMDNNARNYMAAAQSGDEAKKELYAALIADQVNGLAPGAGDAVLGQLLK